MKAKSDQGGANHQYAVGQYAKASRSKARVISDEQMRDLRDFATENALGHGFDDVDSLRSFLVEMWLLMDMGSAVHVAGDRVAVPSDQPEFKPTREQLKRLCQHLEAAAAILREVPENETLGAALHHCDHTGQLDEQYQSVMSLLDTCQNAASLEGRAGRRSNEDWVRDFCIACQKYWKGSGKDGSSIVFNTEFPTPITRWAESVYAGLRRLRGERDDLSKLRSAAKSISAYRD